MRVRVVTGAKAADASRRRISLLLSGISSVRLVVGPLFWLRSRG